MNNERKLKIIANFVKFVSNCYDTSIIISYDDYREETQQIKIDFDILGNISHMTLYTPLELDINFNFIYNQLTDYVNQKIIESYNK